MEEMTKKCPICGTEFKTANSKRIYCSSQCRVYYCARRFAERRREKVETEGVCFRCGIRPAEPGRTRCTECLAAAREYQRQWSRKHRAEAAKKNNTLKERRCRIFYCGRRGGSYCCSFCNRRANCPNRCLNSPAKCNQYEGG